jgi:putative peptidoglycan lipid II flippase
MAITDGTLEEAAPGVQRDPRNIKISAAMTVGRAALLLSLMIALSRIAGFGRMMLTSYLYGISPVTDAYNAAFNIPDTLTILIAGGALATGFVPVFTEYLSKGHEEAARRTFRALFTLIFLSFGLLTIVLFALTFTPYGTLLAPKKVNKEVADLYLYLLRILLVAQFFYVMGGVFTGTLNALRLFWYPALQPVVFNVGIIIFGILLPHYFGMGIESQAWGALVGAIVGSLLIQVPAVLRNGLSLQPLLDMNDPGVRRVLRSLLPIVFGLASGQVIALNLPRFFATGLGTGPLTSLDNANRLMQVPLAVLASGPAIALFPTISMLAAQGKLDEMRTQMAATFRRILLLMMLSTAIIAALSFPIVRVLLQHGRFTTVDSKKTAAVLFCYAFALIGLGAQQLLARGFYATQSTRAPVFLGVVAMLIFCGLGSYMSFVHPLGAVGLAVAAVIAVTLLSFLMWVFLRAKLGGWDDGATLNTIVKGGLASTAAYLATLWAARGADWLVNYGFDFPAAHASVKILARLGIIAVGATAGAVAFILVAIVLRVPELGSLMRRRR